MLTEAERKVSVTIAAIILAAHECRLALDGAHHKAAQRHLGRCRHLVRDADKAIEKIRQEMPSES